MSDEIIDLVNEPTTLNEEDSVVYVSEVIDLVSPLPKQPRRRKATVILAPERGKQIDKCDVVDVDKIQEIPPARSGVRCPVCWDFREDQISGNCGHVLCVDCMTKIRTPCNHDLYDSALMMCDACEEPSPKRFAGVVKRSAATKGRRNPIPPELMENADLQRAIADLPSNYNFEIVKTVWRLQQEKARRVALQFPEGLLMYACVISDILRRFVALEHCFVLGDVTYGACCVDDYTAQALQCDFLVHYGHSCLIPVDLTHIPCLYVFVTIEIVVDHFVQTLRTNFPTQSHIALAGTIQFSPAIHAAKGKLEELFDEVVVPQSRPLSAGEVLGCTAPRLKPSVDTIVFVADGRFHLEALMMANPEISAYRYDPYSSQLTQETYHHDEMKRERRQAIEAARTGQRWGVILGSLGRQGNPAIVQKLNELLSTAGKPVLSFVMSEIHPDTLARIDGIDVWVQVGCPRLSIDWGGGFQKPVLTPYEAMAALRAVPCFWERDQRYPMDYYAKESGPWSSSYHKKRTN